MTLRARWVTLTACWVTFRLFVEYVDVEGVLHGMTFASVRTVQVSQRKKRRNVPSHANASLNTWRPCCREEGSRPATKVARASYGAQPSSRRAIRAERVKMGL